jgi:hypothetical protein
MTDTTTVVRELEGWVLDGVRKGNTVAVEALKVLTDGVQPLTAVIPAVTPPLAYEFAEQFVATERKFAEDVLHLTARLTPSTKGGAHK